jgi:hypothetical protein
MREVWVRLLARVGLQHLAPESITTLADWWLQTRRDIPDSHRRAFDSLVLLVAWVIWKERNARTFRSTARTSSQVIDAVTDELNTLVTAGYGCLAMVLTEFG